MKAPIIFYGIVVLQRRSFDPAYHWYRFVGDLDPVPVEFTVIVGSINVMTPQQFAKALEGQSSTSAIFTHSAGADCALITLPECTMYPTRTALCFNLRPSTDAHSVGTLDGEGHPCLLPLANDPFTLSTD